MHLKRSNFIAASSATALGMSASNATSKAAATNGPLPQTGSSVPELAAFDRVMLGLLEHWDIPGGQCAVAKDGRLVYSRGFGYIDRAQAGAPLPAGVSPTARFRIASSTKPFTAVAVLRLMEQGKLRLEDRAFEILHDFAPPSGTTPDPRLRDITIRQLLEHSAGFVYPDATGFDPQFNALRLAAKDVHHSPPATAAELVRWVMGRPLGFSPGTKYTYSNVGYNILGRVLEYRTGLPYAAALKGLVLDPAGITNFAFMTRTSPQSRLADEVHYDDGALQIGGYPIYDDDLMQRAYSDGGFDGRAIDSHGGGIACAQDLTRFLDAVNGSTGFQLLAPQTIGLMLARPKFWPASGQFYGLGWDVNPPGRVTMSHAGAITFGTFSAIFRLEHGITFAALFNHLDTNVETMGLDVEHQLTAAGYSIKQWPPGNRYSIV